ncbi:AMP-binding protein [Streptomyces sp. NPDC050549]|uniref:AMP-binding protein n=1 Tax=Streptomyces sp. NPDC050549 TaxID=3155406 RepID=UPI00344879A8
MQASIVDVVADHARDFPDRLAVVFVHEDDGLRPLETSMSYAELDRAARARAVWLRGRCGSGERVLLLYRPGLEFVKSLLGCMYAGMVPVPAPVPDGRRHHLQRATGIALDADPRIALTDSTELPTVAAWADQPGLDHMLCSATNIAATGSPDEWRRPLISREPFALLQYTWGATAEPHGVMIGHDNLLHGLDSYRRALRLDLGAVFANWLPVEQGTGVVPLLLMPLYLGATTVMTSSVGFLRSPRIWTRMMSRWRAEASVAPDFGYALCAAESTPGEAAELDLSAWKYAFVSGGALDRAALTRFTERFAVSGFRPSVLRTSYNPPGTSGCATFSLPDQPAAVLQINTGPVLVNDELVDGSDTRLPRLVSRGAPVDLDVRVVHPQTLAVVPDGKIGEIWLRGKSLGRGFWNKQDATVRTFRAVTADGDGGFLRTGDFGAVLDGEIYVSGRLEDVVVHEGGYLHLKRLLELIEPLDEGFRGLTGSVFTVQASDPEVVVLHEYAPALAASRSLAELAAEIRSAAAGACGVSLGGLVLVQPGILPRTQTGRVSRRLARELFVNDALSSLYEDLRPELLSRYRPHAVNVAEGSLM